MTCFNTLSTPLGIREDNIRSISTIKISITGRRSETKGANSQRPMKTLKLACARQAFPRETLDYFCIDELEPACAWAGSSSSSSSIMSSLLYFLLGEWAGNVGKCCAFFSLKTSKISGDMAHNSSIRATHVALKNHGPA